MYCRSKFLIFFVLLLSFRTVRQTWRATSRLAAVLAFYNCQPKLKPNKITDDEVNNKCSIEIGQPDIG
jgi:hypothetical protein